MSSPPIEQSPQADRSAPQSAVFRDHWTWYVGTSAFWFSTSLKWFILFLLLPAQVGEIVPGGTKNSAWGQVFALGALEAMIGPAIFGYLSDRTRSRWGRRRPFIAIGAAITAVALLFLGRAESLPMMIVGYLFLQISDDIGTGPYAALIPDNVPQAKRGLASGVMSQLQLLAQIVAAGIGIALGSNFMAIYVTIAVINIVGALIVLATVPERSDNLPPVRPTGDGPATVEARLRQGAREWIAPWKSRDFRWVWITRFLGALGFYLITTYAVNYLTDAVKVFTLPGVSIGKPFIAAVVVALCISLAGALASVFAGKLSDRIGRKKVYLYSSWVMFAALIPFALVPVYAAIVPLALIFGAGYGAYLTASWALASDVLPSEGDAAKDMGIWQASVSTPQILSGAAGFIVDLVNRSQPGRGYSVAFLISAAAFLAGGLLIQRVRGKEEPGPRPVKAVAG